MSENSFYEGLLGLSHLRVDDVAIESKRIRISCHISVKESVCVSCGNKTTIINQHTSRKLQDLSIVGKEVTLQIQVPQFYCEDCNGYFSCDLGFADANKSYTHRQSRWIFELCHQQPFTEVGALVNLSHRTVANIYFQQAQSSVDVKKRFEKVRKIGIDEISHRKGKGDYCCVLTDLERGITLDILPNRKKETIIAYFTALGAPICRQIQAVACDIWEPYILAARHCFPNAEITLDRFHIVKALNDALDAVRKSLRKSYKNVEEYKKIKWVLFKQPQNCTEKQLELLEQAFNKSPTLRQFYIQRNRLHDIYNNAKDAPQMAKLLLIWTEQALKLEHPVLDKFVRTVKNWVLNIASYANTFVTNAVTEGLNNIIRQIKRISFGMPKFEHLRLRLLARNY